MNVFMERKKEWGGWLQSLGFCSLGFRVSSR